MQRSSGGPPHTKLRGLRPRIRRLRALGRRRRGAVLGRAAHAPPAGGCGAAACCGLRAISCARTSSTTCWASGLHGTAAGVAGGWVSTAAFPAGANGGVGEWHAERGCCSREAPAQAPAHLSKGSWLQQRCMRSASAGGQSGGTSGRTRCWDTCAGQRATVVWCGVGAMCDG